MSEPTQEPRIVTPDQAFAMVIARQRDTAMSDVARLEVTVQQLTQVNQDLGKTNEALRAELAALKPPPADAPAASDTVVKSAQQSA